MPVYGESNDHVADGVTWPDPERSRSWSQCA